MPIEKHLAKEIKPLSKFLRIFFFVSGVIATIAYRITFLLDPLWTKIIWYVGTVGFILYFGHRTNVEGKRAKLVKEYGLIDTINKSDIEGDKKVALSYLIKTSLTSKARFNSAFIFIASILALIVSATIDIFHIHI